MLFRNKITCTLLILLLLPFAGAQRPEKQGITPNSFLWGIDKAIDRISFLLTSDPAKRARKGLKIARERLLEVKAMAEIKDIKSAEKAKEAHSLILKETEAAVEKVEKTNTTQELDQVIDIEKELEEHQKEIEETDTEIIVKIKGDVSRDTLEKISGLISSLREKTGELEIKVSSKKEKIKVELKQKTGKTKEEVEAFVRVREKEKGLVKSKKAAEEIKEAEEEIKELEEEAIEKNIRSITELTQLAKEKLNKSKESFDEGKFGRAFGLARAVKKIADTVERSIEEHEDVEEKEEKRKEIEEKQKEKLEEMREKRKEVSEMIKEKRKRIKERNKTKIEIKSDIELSNNIKTTLEKLSASLKDRIELKLKIKKEQKNTTVEVSVKDGNLTAEQEVLWKKLQKQLKEVVETQETRSVSGRRNSSAVSRETEYEEVEIEIEHKIENEVWEEKEQEETKPIIIEKD